MIEDTMTPDDYAIKFCNSNDVPFSTDSKKYRALVQTIAAAVAAEREACAKVAGQAVMRVKTSTQQARDMTLAEFRSVCSSAAEDAIRARSNDPH